MYHASICSEELNCYSFFLSARLNMAKRKRKEHRITGDGVGTKDTRKWKRKNPADSAGTDGAIEGQSPVENCTNGVSCATSVVE